MKRGLILINAYSELPASLNQSARLKDELEKLGVHTDVKRNDFFPVAINDCGEAEMRADGYDFCIYLDKDKYVSALLEKCGMRLFNRHEAIRLCDDKAETHVALCGKGIPMPSTVTGLLCYDPQTPVKESALRFIEESLGLPVVIKESYGSLGRGVYRADNRGQLREIAEKLKCRPHLFQRYIAESSGRDIRVIVIGGKVAAAMQRISEDDFRSNIELGGRGEPFSPDGKLTELCERVAYILGLDYCGIDVLIGRDGYMVCEVNSNAFFGGIEKVTAINVAELYARHIYGVIYG